MSSVFVISSTIGNPNAMSDDVVKDRIAITDVVNSMGTLADLGQYDRLEQAAARVANRNNTGN